LVIFSDIYDFIDLNDIFGPLISGLGKFGQQLIMFVVLIQFLSDFSTKKLWFAASNTRAKIRLGGLKRQCDLNA